MSNIDIMFNLEKIPTPLDDIWLLKPKVFVDNRGYFKEQFNKNNFEHAIGSRIDFVQDNQSLSRYLTVRGMHYQYDKPQGKLVSVLNGEIYDVVVDLRTSSKTYGRWFGVHLSSTNHLQLWVPIGFAHGFMALSEETIISYKTTDFYDAKSEVCLNWLDNTVNIRWPVNDLSTIKISKKDLEGKQWNEIPKF